MVKGKTVLGIFVCMFVLAGCVGPKETLRGIAGISTKALQEKRDEALSETFDLKPDVCWTKARQTLKEMGAYIYTEDKENGLIAVYVSASDTTPVGIFITDQDGKSLVEVSSRSTYIKELMAEDLFSRME